MRFDVPDFLVEYVQSSGDTSVFMDILTISLTIVSKKQTRRGLGGKQLV